jgi:integrase
MATNKPQPEQLCGNYRRIKTTVEPIRFSRQLGLIRQLLQDKPRDLLLFTLGVNSGLRMKDLLNLRVFQVKDVPSGGFIRIGESKTKKTNTLVINGASHKVLTAYLEKAGLADDDYLFKTRYGKQLTSLFAGRLVARWCKKIGLEGNFGCHTLRKTWAYHMRIKFQTDWSLITERLNHSSPAITRRYLCITEGEIIDLLQNVVD